MTAAFIRCFVAVDVVAVMVEQVRVSVKGPMQHWTRLGPDLVALSPEDTWLGPWGRSRLFAPGATQSHLARTST
jgi:hypothetical protein